MPPMAQRSLMQEPSAAPPPAADVVVVGAGIVGLATAETIVRRAPGTRVVVVEKEETPALHQSGRNSCVVHAGVYYAPGTLKAELCVRGRELLRRFCDEEGVPFERCGKVIVAVNEVERPRLAELHRRGVANGVAGLELVGPERLRELEPHVSGVEALHVPSTAIVDFRLVCAALRGRVEQAGGIVTTDAEVSRLDERTQGVLVETTRGTIEAATVVACGGLQADRLIAASGIDDTDSSVIVPFRGDYFALQGEARRLCRNLIYPVPDPAFPFLGIHVSRRPDGSVWAGPNAVVALARERYRRHDVQVRDAIATARARPFWRLVAANWRLGLRELYRDLSRRAFAEAVRHYIPDVSSEDLVPAPAGIRPQALRPDGSLADDFIFVESRRIVHVKNAPSPAATSSLAIAERIADRVSERARLKILEQSDGHPARPRIGVDANGGSAHDHQDARGGRAAVAAR
jgi:L-2-hydroxyglutarate oxidase